MVVLGKKLKATYGSGYSYTSSLLLSIQAYIFLFYVLGDMKVSHTCHAKETWNQNESAFAYKLLN